MKIQPTTQVARYIELENLHNKTIQELNTSFGGAVESIYSYDPNESTANKFSKNADFMLKRLDQISTLNSTIKELNELLAAGVLAEVHQYYTELRNADKVA